MYEVRVHSDNGPDLTYEATTLASARRMASEELQDGARKVEVVGPDGRVVDEYLADDEWVA